MTAALTQGGACCVQTDQEKPPAADRPLSPLTLCEVSSLHLGCSSLEEFNDYDTAVQGAYIYPLCPETVLPDALKQHPAVI